jgi:hypothetical protein
VRKDASVAYQNVKGFHPALRDRKFFINFLDDLEEPQGQGVRIFLG